TSAIDRSVMVVPLASNAPHTSGFLEVRSPRSAISSAMRRGNFKRADAFAMWWSLLALRVGQSEEFVDGAIGRHVPCARAKRSATAVRGADDRCCLVLAERAGELCGRAAGIRHRACQAAFRRIGTVRQSQ